MTIEELRKVFGERLSHIYPKKDILTLYNILLNRLAGLEPYQVLSDPDRRLEEPTVQGFFLATDRLLLHEPIQYITGKADFAGLSFYVTPQVLIPRPETEELAAWIGEEVPPDSKSGTLLDVGTGSGCIAITLAHRFPGFKVTGTDISAAALEIAKRNADQHHVSITWIAWNIFSSPPASLRGTYDIILSNPPYIPDDETATIGKNVLLHEPHIALLVPAGDPLLFYRAILDFACDRLKPDGSVFFEIHPPLVKKHIELAKSKGFGKVSIRCDFSGKERMLRCCR